MLYILIGISGSGKSTFAEKNCRVNHNMIQCSSDLIRKELYGDENIQGNGAEVFRILNDRTLIYLHEDRDVIYDATNTTRKSRKKIIKLAKEFTNDICAVYFKIPLDVCLERNAKRDRKVPEEVIRKMFYQLQEPSKEEGFDAIVTITDGITE